MIAVSRKSKVSGVGGGDDERESDAADDSDDIGENGGPDGEQQKVSDGLGKRREGTCKVACLSLFTHVAHLSNHDLALSSRISEKLGESDASNEFDCGQHNWGAFTAE